MIYERFKRLIEEKKEEGPLSPEFIQDTTYRLGEFYKKGKITKQEHDELIDMLKE